MSSAMMMERGMMGMNPTTTSPMTPGMGQVPNFCVVPRCEIKMEKCTGGTTAFRNARHHRQR